MSRSVNNVTLLGNLTRNLEVRKTKSAKSVCDFTIATNRAYTDEQGQRHEQADFHHIVAWGNLADIAGKYLVKGSRVYVAGRLQNHEWEAEGQKKSRTEIVIDEMLMLDNKAVIDAVNELEAADDSANTDSHPNAAFAEADAN